MNGTTPKDMDTTELEELRMIRLLLQGTPDRPGLVQDVNRLKHDVYGNGTAGMKTRVNVMWRIHVWLLCTASGIIGSALTWGLVRVLHLSA